MLAHEFKESQDHSTNVGDNPREVKLLLRCMFCNRTPSKAPVDGCAIREVEERGSVLLSDFNPDGKIRFAGRRCATCEQPIMGHRLRKGLPYYWCFDNQLMWSDGLKPVAVDEKEYWPDAAKYR